ncbi:NAD(P)-dependent oxidoreductase [SAR202 cluster bacterium AD-802-F09_MRT_200m]|nr:NAD(P)-dependent oxidoreductase [SAR202 cluster bacterium AD-802-F09_MRT_200m]
MGSTLARVLLDQGHQVRALDSLLHGGQSVQGLYMYDDFSFMRGDIREPDTVREALEGVDAVVHLAAIVGDPACARHPEIARDVNQHGALQLYQISQDRGIERFIFASTCSNYGRMPDPSAYVTEESDLNPVSLYAETKVAVENHLLDSMDFSRAAVTVLRFATLYGLSPRMRFDLTVNTFTKEFLTQGKLLVFGEQFWRPYVHVLDAARAIALVLASPRDKVEGQVFNVGDEDQNYQKGQLAALVQGQVGDHMKIEHVDRDEDPRDYRVSFEKIKRELGFQVTRTVEDGVREIMDAINQGVVTDLDDPHYHN